MDTDPVLIEANRWFKKLNNPSNAVFKIAHARMSEEAKAMFVPMRVLKQYKRTSNERMQRLVAAVSNKKGT